MGELTQMIRTVADRRVDMERADAAYRTAEQTRSEAVQRLADAETALADKINAVHASAYLSARATEPAGPTAIELQAWRL